MTSAACCGALEKVLQVWLLRACDPAQLCGGPPFQTPFTNRSQTGPWRPNLSCEALTGLTSSLPPPSLGFSTGDQLVHARVRPAGAAPAAPGPWLLFMTSISCKHEGKISDQRWRRRPWPENQFPCIRACLHTHIQTVTCRSKQKSRMLVLILTEPVQVL